MTIHISNKYLLNVILCRILCYPLKFTVVGVREVRLKDTQKEPTLHLAFLDSALQCKCLKPVRNFTLDFTAGGKGSSLQLVSKPSFSMQRFERRNKRKFGVLKLSISSSILIPEFHYGSHIFSHLFYRWQQFVFDK